MKFSPDQEQAIETISQWRQGSDQMAVLGGLAGTGKTTVTSHLIKEVFGTDHVIVACPTGKAAAVLRDKGVMASTIHSVAYTYLGRNLDDQKKLDFEFEGVNADTLIVDEASMVDECVHTDLMRSGARILYVGDYGQLPPVGKDPGIMQNMTAWLTQVHRQGDDLLDFAHAVREGEYWPFETEHVVRVHKNDSAAAMQAADIVLCMKNSTRHRINLQLFFHAMGITADEGQDRLRGLWFDRQIEEFFAPFAGRAVRCMCVKNNRTANIWNGSLGTFDLEKVTEWGLRGRFTNDVGEERAIEASFDGWGTNPGDVDWQQNDPQIALDLGYCITVHKSQGSEFNNVVVLDETFPRMSDRNKWRYTAATRAKKAVVWIPWRTA